MAPTKAQKFRLGLFLAISTTVLVGTIMMMLGTSFLEERDTYYVRFEGSVGGLEPGSQVRLNGIRVGRVEDVEIDEEPGFVEVTLSLEAGTPVTEDTVAVLNMQGITGLKYIELSGSTAGSEPLEPGSEIEAGGSQIDMLTEKAGDIAIKLDRVLDNLVTATGGENLDKIQAILDEVEGTLRETRLLIANNRVAVTKIVDNVETTSNELPVLADKVSSTLTQVEKTVASVESLVDRRQIRRVLNLLASTLEQLEKRVGPDELGKVLANADTLVTNTNTLVTDANVTLLRLRDDLRRTLDELASSTENFAEFTQILVEDPSALISGRSERDRFE